MLAVDVSESKDAFKSRIAPVEDHEGKLVLEKFTLYETKTKFYVVASNQADSRYRILKIDRTADDGISIIEDPTVYSQAQITDLLRMIEDGNKASGGLIRVLPLFYGLLGFTKFTAGWYAVLIKQRAAVGLIGGHYIFHCEETLIVPIDAKPEKSADEVKQLQAFQHVDLSKNFYFSYTYDITNTLQRNLIAPSSEKISSFYGYNDKFVWNHYMLQSAFTDRSKESPWVLPLIHGFVDQAKMSVFGRTVYVTLIARRSRHFAGARFLKRGINEEGYVANDVETEQIVSEALTTPFHAPLTRNDQLSNDKTLPYRLNPRYTSYVQHRGSIPIHWTQDASGMQAKPPIGLGIVNPFFSPAARHFDDLFARYGCPVIVLNLIKSKERIPRESKLLPEFVQCINYLNQFLPAARKVEYIGFDIATANKKHNVDVIARLEDEAQKILEKTNFFHSGAHPASYAYGVEEGLPQYRSAMLLQEGICRTNCIDCLDRTNAAQFIVGKAALGRQLHALGIYKEAIVPFDSDATNLLTEMYHDHGDTIALQYGGSNLVNTIESYKIKQWSSHSRDMIEGLRRYYANSFSDAEKQKSINLFLGIQDHDVPAHLLPRPPNKSYVQWYTPENLQDPIDPKAAAASAALHLGEDCDYWTEYYRPRLFTEMGRHFAFKVNNTLRYVAHTLREDTPSIAQSPFLPRVPGQVITKRQIAQHYRSRSAHIDISPGRGTQSRAELSAVVENALPPANTTEGLSLRLLQPSVSSDLAAEYDKYLNQKSMIVSEDDRRIYASAVAVQNTFAARTPMKPLDIKLYENSCNKREIFRSQLQGWSSNAVAV